MSKIAPMKCNEFADFLLTLEPGEIVNFATGIWNNDVPFDKLEPDDLEYFYFVTIMEVPEYQSRFILIDYAGGEQAFAIPLNWWYRSEPLEEDKAITRLYMKRFFTESNHLSGPDDTVYVEMEE